MEMAAELIFNKNWTLFLDRDGVINKKIENDYVKKWDEFEFLPGVFDALKKFNSIFGTTIIVTNQQGIGRGAFTERDLAATHERMMHKIRKAGGRIDRIYFCPALASSNDPDRKPGTGMAFRAQKDFPGIEFKLSLIAGDSISDMEFGRSLGMATVYIKDKLPSSKNEMQLIDHHFHSLEEFAANC